MKKLNVIGNDMGQANIEENITLQVDFSDLKSVIEQLEGKVIEKEQKANDILSKGSLKKKAYEDEIIRKYASLDKEALLKKVATFEWVMSGVEVALNLLRPLANMLLGDSKLSQAFNLLDESVKTWKTEKERTHIQLW